MFRNITLACLALFFFACEQNPISSASSEAEFDLSAFNADVFDDARHQLNQDLMPFIAARTSPGTLDHAFARMGTEIAGFGGYYYEGEGQLVVRLAGNVEMRGAEALKGKVKQLAVQNRLTDYSDAHFHSVQIRYEKAKYSFIELASWRCKIQENLPNTMDVILTDADERTNQVVIGLLQDPNDVQVKPYLESLGIPVDAVRFKKHTPSRLVHGYEATPRTGSSQVNTLQDRVRPIAGGLEINNGCTLGIPVWHSQQQGGGDPDPVIHPWGFLTASHCTEFVDYVEPRDMYQPTFLNSADLIGVEYREPMLNQTLPCTYATWICLDADVALINIPDDHGLQKTVGQIYLPTGLGDRSLTIDQTLLVTLDREPIIGETVQKVGRTSGWTEGPVTASCVNESFGGGFKTRDPLGDPNGVYTDRGGWILCHTHADLPTMSGDSGSAVFKNRGNLRGDFLGIISYTYCKDGVCAVSPQFPTAFAPWSSIQTHLGTDVRTRLE